jgi:hypothetical protein
VAAVQVAEVPPETRVVVREVTMQKLLEPQHLCHQMSWLMEWLHGEA